MLQAPLAISATFQVAPSIATDASSVTTMPALSASEIQQILLEESTRQQDIPSANSILLLSVSEHQAKIGIRHIHSLFMPRRFHIFVKSG
jgi:hypothetical protein